MLLQFAVKRPFDIVWIYIAALKGAGKKQTYFFIEFYDKERRDLHNAFCRIKILIFHEDMYLSCFIYGVNRVFRDIFLQMLIY